MEKLELSYAPVQDIRKPTRAWTFFGNQPPFSVELISKNVEPQFGIGLRIRVLAIESLLVALQLRLDGLHCWKVAYLALEWKRVTGAGCKADPERFQRTELAMNGGFNGAKLPLQFCEDAVWYRLVSDLGTVVCC